MRRKHGGQVSIIQTLLSENARVISIRQIGVSFHFFEQNIFVLTINKSTIEVKTKRLPRIAC